MSCKRRHENAPVAAPEKDGALKRRDLLLSGSSLLAASALAATGLPKPAAAQQPQPAAAPPAPAPASGKRPNILVVFGDDIGPTSAPTPSG